MTAHRFDVLELVGGGSASEVHRAVDTVLGEPVALKFSSDAERLKREARIARRLAHPNVVRVHELHEADGRAFLSMQWLDGETLSSRVGRGGPLSARAVTRLLRGLASALAAAHRAGIVHADIKPDNVMVTVDGDPVLFDFGSAREPGDPRAAELDGTPGFMAPEQQSRAAVTPSTDVFALGRTIAFALGLGDDVGAWRRAPSSLRTVLRTCLAVAPGDRFADGGALLAALDRGQRHRTAIAVVAAASTASIGLVAWTHSVSDRPPIVTRPAHAQPSLPLWVSAQALARAGRLGEAKAAYTEALRRFALDETSPEATHFMRPCLVEALALARRMNDRDTEAALATELAGLDRVSGAP